MAVFTFTFIYILSHIYSHIPKHFLTYQLYRCSSTQNCLRLSTTISSSLTVSFYSSVPAYLITFIYFICLLLEGPIPTRPEERRTTGNYFIYAFLILESWSASSSNCEAKSPHSRSIIIFFQTGNCL